MFIVHLCSSGEHSKSLSPWPAAALHCNVVISIELNHGVLKRYQIRKNAQGINDSKNNHNTFISTLRNTQGHFTKTIDK